jgi:hypothetical protein
MEPEDFMNLLIERGIDEDEAWCAAYMNEDVEFQGQIFSASEIVERLDIRKEYATMVAGFEAEKANREQPMVNSHFDFPSEWELRGGSEQ